MSQKITEKPLAEGGVYNGYTGYLEPRSTSARRGMGATFRPGRRKKPENLVELSSSEQLVMIEAFLDANPDRRTCTEPRSL